MDKLFFIANLYVGAICCLSGGFGETYEFVQWRLHNHAAQMMLSNPAQVPSSPIFTSGLFVDVKYVEANGRETWVQRKWIKADMAKRMARGESIPIWFIFSEPMVTYSAKDDVEFPWAWLILGVILWKTARYGHKLWLKEIAEEEAGEA